VNSDTIVLGFIAALAVSVIVAGLSGRLALSDCRASGEEGVVIGKNARGLKGLFVGLAPRLGEQRPSDDE
jgi:hypothetical protein